mmetsp:Transcript_33613/g.79588  ORF Transcript_33613/g.79588 Transcript_33613/m.79588 type:complete len:205 (+) Transcript_33613:1-615(+)
MLAASGKLEMLDDVRYPIDISKISGGIQAAAPEFHAAREAGQHDANMNRIPTLEVEGISIGNTAAIERFVAKRIGMYGKTDLEAALIDQTCENIADISADFIKAKGGPGPAGAEKGDEWLKTKLPEWAAKLEKSIGSNTGFAVGEGTTTQADVRIYYFIHGYFDAKEAVLEGFKDSPKCMAIATRIAADPLVVSYLAGRKVTPN